MRVLCTRSLFDSQSKRFYQEGKVYDIEPVPMLANFFGFEPELRARLRAEHAVAMKKPVSDAVLAKLATADAQKLIEIAHAKGLGQKEPRTLVDLAPKSSPALSDKPVVLADLTKSLDSSFLE